MIKFEDIKNNPKILEFISQTERALTDMSFTNHGLRHCELVASRARNIAKEIGLSEGEQEMASIAAFCHDIGNFLSRTYHNYLGAIMFQNAVGDLAEPKELAIIMQAISNHDKIISDVNFKNPISDIVILADKSDVHRTRVSVNSIAKIKTDIHDRVNFATKANELKVDKKEKRITLSLEIDSDFVPIMEYFEIFTGRMVFCRKAAQGLGYNFGLVINNFKLL